ncbi:MAG: NAD(P)-dependent oxidoreductase [Candidatus Dormibacteria bacterium]
MVRISVFGSTGKTGQHVVEQALARGHTVQALVRRPEAFTIEHENLDVTQGDVLAPARWADRLTGVDAVKRLVLYPILQSIFGASYDDMRRMEQILSASQVGWTILRPPYLTDAAPKGRYRLGIDAPLKRAISIGRSDLAAALLDTISDERLSRRAVEVAA